MAPMPCSICSRTSVGISCCSPLRAASWEVKYIVWVKPPSSATATVPPMISGRISRNPAHRRPHEGPEPRGIVDATLHHLHEPGVVAAAVEHRERVVVVPELH